MLTVSSSEEILFCIGLVVVLFTNFLTTFPVLICIRFPSPNFLAQDFFSRN